MPDQKDPVFDTWWCQRCPWYRDLSRDPEQQCMIIDHPVYGRVTAYVAFRMDIIRHSCSATYEARERYGIPSVKREKPYQHLPKERNARVYSLHVQRPKDGHQQVLPRHAAGRLR